MHKYKDIAVCLACTVILFSGCAEEISDEPEERVTTANTVTNAIAEVTGTEKEFIHGLFEDDIEENAVTYVPEHVDIIPETTTEVTTVYDSNVPLKFIDAAILRVTSDYSWLDNVEQGYIYCSDITMDGVPDFVVLDTSKTYGVSETDVYMATVYELRDMYNVGSYLDNESLNQWGEYVDENGVHKKYATFTDEYSGLESLNEFKLDALGTIKTETLVERFGDTFVIQGEEKTLDEYLDYTNNLWSSLTYVQPRDCMKGASIEELKNADEETRYMRVSTLFGDYAGSFETPDLSTIWE